MYGPGVNVQDTSTADKIVAQAYEFLERNLITGRHNEYGYEYSFSMPSSYKYGPSQWLWGIVSNSSGADDRLGSPSNYVGEERCQSSNRGFERDVELSITRRKNSGNDKLACRETGIRIALFDEDTILTYNLQRPNTDARSSI